MLEFDTTSSSILSELRAILEDLNEGDASADWNGSDPDVTKFLLGLVGTPEEKFSSPFQLSDNVRRGLIERAEQAGSRALSWNLSQFDSIGGKGTIRSVWKSLKSEDLVGGRKRAMVIVGAERNAE